MSQLLQTLPSGAEIYLETNEEYHASDAISNSALKLVGEYSPMHYHSQYILGEKPEPTEAKIMGALTHSALLEPKRFLDNMRLAPDAARNTKAGKEEWVAFSAGLNPGAIVVTHKQHECIMRQIAALQKHPDAAGLLRGGFPERSVYVKHTEHPWRRKMRPDFLREDRIIVDLKTTQDARYRQFMRDVERYGYDFQCAYYWDIFTAAWGTPPDAFIWIVMEKKAPYACAVYIAMPRFIEGGRAKYRKAEKTLARCLAKNEWPGYQFDEKKGRQMMQELHPPDYYMFDEETADEEEEKDMSFLSY